MVTIEGTDDQLNPFSTNIDIKGNNQAGSGKSGTEYTMPLTDTLDQFLNSTYRNYIVIIRYKGSNQLPVTNITVGY